MKAITSRIAALSTLTTISLLAGCGNFQEKFGRQRDDGHTSVRFAGGRGAAAATLNGGVMVYAIRQSDGYRAAFQLQHEADAREFSLPNGAYKFLAIGWTGADLTGPNKCGAGGATPGNVISLAGQAVTVPITLAAATCAEPTFSPADHLDAGEFRFPQLAFCSPETDVSGKAPPSATCANGQESSRFIRGRNSGGKGLEHATFSPVSQRLVYLADYHTPGKLELFSVRPDGQGTVRQSHDLGVGGSVDYMEVIPDTNKVIYLAAQATGQPKQLYVSTLGEPGGTRIHTEISAGVSTGVRTFEISKSGHFLVMAADLDNSGKVALYSLRINAGFSNASVPAQISSTPTGLGIKSFNGGEARPENWGFRLSPNLADPEEQIVAYVGKFTNAAYEEVAYTNIRTGSPILGHAPPAFANAMVSDMGFSYSGAFFVWKMNSAVGGSRYDVFRGNPVDGSNVKLSASAITTANTFALSPFEDVVVFGSDKDTSGFFDLMAVQLPGPVSHEIVNGFNASKSFGNYHFAPGKVAFVHNSGADFQPFTSSLTGTAVNVSSRVVPVESGGGGDSRPLYLTQDGTKLYFRADGEVHVASFGVVADARLSEPMAGNIRSTSLVTDGVYPYFATSTAAGGDFRAYSSDGVNPTPVSLGTHPAITSVEELHLPESGWTIQDSPNPILISGFVGGPSGLANLFLKKDRNVPNSPLGKLTHSFTNASYGAGRFRFSVLAFQSDSTGTIAPTGGILGSCQGGTTGDGTFNSAGTPRLPPGDGTNQSPFALALDIFPQATDCTGPFQRILLPRGTAYPAASPQADKLRIVPSGVQLYMYVKD